MNTDLPEYLTAKEVAAYLRLDIGTIYRMVRERRIPFFLITRAIRFRRADLEAWEKRRTQGRVERDRTWPKP